MPSSWRPFKRAWAEKRALLSGTKRADFPYFDTLCVAPLACALASFAAFCASPASLPAWFDTSPATLLASFWAPPTRLAAWSTYCDAVERAVSSVLAACSPVS